MLVGVYISCAAGCYALVLVLEVLRPVLVRLPRIWLILFALLGLLAHVVAIYFRAAAEPAAPLSSEQDWYLTVSWMVAAVCTYLLFSRPQTPFGLFLLPLVLLMLVAAVWLADTRPLVAPASRVWGAVHGLALLFTTVSVLVGFVSGLMYLIQSGRLKHKRTVTSGFWLPSLEWLQRINSRAILFSPLLLGVGVLSGIVLDQLGKTDASRLSLTDPLIAATWAMFFWLVVAAVLSIVYRPARQGRKVAYLTVAGFVFLLVMLAAGLILESRHWGGRKHESKVQGVGVSTVRAEKSFSFTPLGRDFLPGGHSC